MMAFAFTRWSFILTFPSAYNYLMVNKKMLARYAIREILNVIGMAVALFWSAGRLDWWAGWAAVLVSFAWLAATDIVIIRLYPQLLVDRLEARPGSKPWDMVIVGSIGLVTLIRYIVAGLDIRFAWSGGFSLAAQAAALVVCILGYALFVWAAAYNPFFSRIVRVQAERDHKVITAGPYQIVRHPAYLGVLLYELAVSILLASWWALLVSGISIALLIIRTALEDRALAAELAGYQEYSKQVRFRLLPGIW